MTRIILSALTLALVCACDSHSTKKAPVSTTQVRPMDPAQRLAAIQKAQAQASDAHRIRTSDGKLSVTVKEQALAARFDGRGLELTNGSKTQGRLELATVGRAKSTKQTLVASAPSTTAFEVKWNRGAVDESYRAGPLGLEHTLLVKQKPAGTGRVVLELNLTGLTAQDDGATVTLRSRTGGYTLSDFFVRDARGTLLNGSMHGRGATLVYSFDDVGATYPVEIDPLVATLVTKLTAQAPGFGQVDVAIGTGAALSADGTVALVGTSGDNSQGELYAYTKIDGVWQFDQRLTEAMPDGESPFGGVIAMAADGNLALVPGAMGVHVYVRTAGVWSDQSLLVTTDATQPSNFGNTVALSADGSTAIVGTLNGPGPYVFTRSGATWTQQAKLTFPRNEVSSLALSANGDTALIGDIYTTDNVAARGVVHVFVRTAGTWSEQVSLTASDAIDLDHFGYAVSLSGDGNTALIGQFTGAGVPHSGSAYVFVRSGSTWTQQQKFVSTDFATGDSFGTRVLLTADGNLAVIGAPYNDDAPTMGRVYAFTRSAGVWTQQARITSSGTQTGDNFGLRLALSADGTSALFTAPGEFAPNSRSGGVVYSFSHSGSAWTEGEKLKAPSDDRVPFSIFGNSVALSANGTTALIGTINDAAYVYVKRPAGWQLQSKIVAPELGGTFGIAVALSADGNTAVMGAPGVTSGSVPMGAAFVYERVAGRWNLKTKLVPSDGRAQDKFGTTVSLSADGRVVLVGSWGANSQGAAYVFTKTNSTWGPSVRLQPSLLVVEADGGVQPNSGAFGASTALSATGDVAVVGFNTIPIRTGVEPTAAYVFKRLASGWTQVASLGSDPYRAAVVAVSANGKTVAVGIRDPGASVLVFDEVNGTWTQGTSLGPEPLDEAAAFGGSVALSSDGNALLVGHRDDGEDREPYRLESVYVFARRAGTWVQDARFFPPDNARHENFGWNLALSADRSTALVGRTENFVGVGVGSAFIYDITPPNPTLTPAVVSVPPRGAQLFVCSGGSGAPYSYALSANGSDGGVSNGGAYVAGSTGNTTDTLVCEDALGSATATISVTGGVFAIPSAVITPPRGTTTLTADGGSGTGFTWSLASNISGGSISPTGTYVAGFGGDVVDTLLVTDSLGNTRTVAATVTSGVSVAPATFTTPPRGSASLIVDGGSGTGFTWTFNANNSGATISQSGAYAAGAVGSVIDSIRVTDSLGNTFDVSATVTRGIATINFVAPPRATRTLLAGGGSNTGFTWTFDTNASGGTVTTNGAYTAGATPNVTDTLRVTDSLGNTALVTVTLTAGVTATPSTTTAPPRGSLMLTASGGFNVGVCPGNVSCPAADTCHAPNFCLATTNRCAPTNSTVVTAVDAGSPFTGAVVCTPGFPAPNCNSRTFENSANFAALDAGAARSVTSGTITGVSIHQPRNLNDGRYGNAGAWVANGAANPWVKIDLGKPVAIDTVTFGRDRLGAFADRPTGRVQIAVADFDPNYAERDNTTTYTTVYDSMTALPAAPLSSTTRISFAPVVARFVRLTFGGVGVGIDEVEVFGCDIAKESCPGLPLAGCTNTGGERADGFTWAFVNNRSGGTISQSGAYVAGVTPNVADVLSVTDSLGNTATVTVNVGAGLTASPPSATLAPRAMQTFVASGGSGTGYVWSFGANRSGGSLSASGAYVAGTTGGVVDSLNVIDSLGNSVAVQVNVNSGLGAVPSSLNVPPRGMQTFTASGGTGTGFVWSFVTNASGGTLSAAGVYTAGTTGSVSDVLRVTDSAMNTLDVTVTVTAGVQVTPNATSVSPAGMATFNATGGSGMGYRWTLATNLSGATVTPDGRYTAGSTGGVTDLVRVTDSLGNTASASIVVGNGVLLAPSTVTLPPRGRQSFTASGGTGTGFRWSLPANGSGGSIDGGAYVAGSAGNVTDVAQVVDSAGNSATATITITAGVSSTPSSASVPPRGTQTFTAAGGSGSGFTWALSTNASGGTLTTAGAYTAGTTPGVIDVLRATDSLGNFVDVAVTVSRNVVITPSSPSTAPNGSLTFTATGGSGTGYTWTLETIGSMGATLSPAGVYRAGTAIGTDVVRVTDSLGNSATERVTVTNQLAATPSMVSLAPRAQQTFTATGGSGAGLTWTFVTNNSGATLTSAGAYVAGTTPSVVDTLRVTDSLGNTATASVNVGAGLSVMPTTRTAAPRQALTFTASGGSGSFAWAFVNNPSGGTLSVAGAYVAGNSGGVNDVLRVVDSLGNSLTVTVAVGAGVRLGPADLSLAPRAAQTLTASGGSGTGYVWTFVDNASMGTLNAGTGAYVAGRIGGVTDVVQAVDSLGNIATAAITVTPGVSILPLTATVLPMGTQAFVASGGSNTGFTWSVATNLSGGTITAGGLYTAGATPDVVDVVQVTDSLGNTATRNVSVGAPLVISPQAQTVAVRGTLTFSAMGGTAPYRWALMNNASGGDINTSTGAYTAGSAGGVDTVRVTDARNVTSTTTVTVLAALTASTSSATVPPRGTATLSAQGGRGNATFSLTTNASGGTINAMTGVYVAGAKPSVTDVVTVSDGMSSVTVSIAVGVGVSIAPPQTSVAPSGSASFTATGGSGTGFVWTLSVNNSGATLSASGSYVAGAVGDVADEVTVTDSLGNTATAAIAVTAAKKEGCGCSSGAPGFVFGLLALFARRRRRSASVA